MKRTVLLMFVGLLLCSACASMPARTSDESMQNFLPYLNQKVAGYIDMNQVGSLDAQTYKDIVYKVCGPLPTCWRSAAIMFDTYEVQARSLGDTFSVMLCSKDGTIKVLEDFSCNEQKVEIINFQSDTNVQCIFEDKWKEKVTIDCPGIK